MYIKQIIIQGFKSYKEQTEIERFSPGLNVIVGRNGSGKSNFFAAIRFVLSDAYTQMSREERNALLHEGSGTAVQSAYVEVIFDNSDGRFPNNKPELILRRTIGHKKDEYSLDRKNTTRTDVMNMLESAGFSRSNPYYIVPQGRVTTLTNMKDPERLSLLKEVAGTQVYENRRTESLKSMQQAENMQSKVDVLLSNVDERLSQLEEEKEELRKFQERDREQRCLRYTLLNREQQKCEQDIEKANLSRTTGVEQTEQQSEELDNYDQGITQLERDINRAKQTLELRTIEKRQLVGERKTAQQHKAEVELDVDRLSAGFSSAQQAQAKLQADLKSIQGLIQTRENDLAKMMPKFDQAVKQEADIQSQLDDVQIQQQRLQRKRGNADRFANKAARDKHLQEELNKCFMQLSQSKANRMQLDDDLNEMKKTIATTEKDLTKTQSRLDSRSNDLKALDVELAEADKTLTDLQDQRRVKQREQNLSRSKTQQAREDLQEAENIVSNLTDRDTWKGIKTVRKMANEGMEGIHGMVGELFEVNPNYKTAVEVIGGNSLFSVIVENDDVSTKIVSHLTKNKAGRVTFFPLNRISPKEGSMPNAQDAVSMLSKLKYAEDYEPAMSHVFGRTVICPNLQVASQYARSHGVSAITSQGDRADKKGALTGGYIDTRRSRISAIHEESKARREYESVMEGLESLQEELDTLTQEITKATGEVQKLKQRREAYVKGTFGLQHEIKNQSTDLQRLRNEEKEKAKQKEQQVAAERHLNNDQQAFEEEMKQDFKKALTTQEERTLETLGSQIRDLQKTVQGLTAKRSELEAEVSGVQQQLDENLRPQLARLKAQGVEAELEGEGGGNVNSQLKERQRDLKRVTKELNDVTKQLAKADENLEQSNQNLANLEQEKSKAEQRRDELIRTINEHKTNMERQMQQKATATKALADINRQIRDLGVLPEEAFRKYQKWEAKRLEDRWTKVTKELKQFKSVNKKAFEQFSNFAKQRNDLQTRRDGLDTSKDSIQVLIDHLDRKKDEAIERTFKQVSREFATVFENLVPAGKGRLIIQRKSDRQARQEDEDDSDEEQRNTVENYTGVGISVSFNSKHDEQQRIQQLSGGQKSLCALALVFAIQRCDPAPFYLFDEIDANLDAQYRTAVAKMLEDLSTAGEGGGQFICTTFRPEMLQVAEKCYGVSFSNKTSSVDVVSYDDAMSFVENTQMAR
ncbi:putative chromosome segregation protein SudA [Microthyrium microscopicum]|uniref:Structural maintenance of chromosomes protein n=1 Tax=Microthyrium microscopicum TaxID=703497 RepID=A0A6A6U2X5_9PEZI|nr:putative chromosome segregation protein SudA [Microthyrium microscopicum]